MRELRVRWRTFVAATLAVAGFAARADAGIITQAPGATHVAFEAESDGVVANSPSSGQTFGTAPDAGASGGQTLATFHTSNPANNSGGTDGSTATSFVTYTIAFVTPGTYTLYDTVDSAPATLAADVNAGNSFFYGSTFGAAPNTRSNSNGQGNLTTPTFFADGTFTVASPGTVSFIIGDREAGTQIDRFAFSTEPVADKAAFDALANSPVVVPEPAALGLAATAGMGLLGRRRRR